MARTEGSGWGAGPLLWQPCPECAKKKVLYRYGAGFIDSYFWCYVCKKEVKSETLIRKTHP